MRSNNTPNIQQIFTQKKAYDQHLRKLSDIRQVRKINLTYYNPKRNLQIKQIQYLKQCNFVNRAYDEAEKIADNNFMLFDRLQRELSTPRKRKVLSEVRYAKSRKNEEERSRKSQNKRLKKCISTSYSFINRDKMFLQEKKRIEIKNRVRKYTESGELKSNKFYIKWNRGKDKLLKQKSESPAKNKTFYHKTQMINFDRERRCFQQRSPTQRPYNPIFFTTHE